MVFMNVFCVLAALLLARVTGGMVINIWDLQFLCKYVFYYHVYLKEIYISVNVAGLPLDYRLKRWCYCKEAG